MSPMPIHRWPALIVATALLASACGGGRPEAAQPNPPASSPSTAAAPAAPSPSTTAAPATTAPPPPEPMQAATLPGVANLGGDQHPHVDPDPIGALRIPAIGVDHPIFEGVDLANLHWGPGHWPGTAQPGEPGNSVFAGHRVTHTRPFLEINRLVAGDEVNVSTAAGDFTYRVTGHRIVTPDAFFITEPSPNPTLTFFGCHPRGSARQRYVVFAELVH